MGITTVAASENNLNGSKILKIHRIKLPCFYDEKTNVHGTEITRNKIKIVFKYCPPEWL